MKKVLIITYYWPPSGGSGVQRWLKFAKYLPAFGWEPVIYTVENGEFPVIDESLLAEVPKNITVIKKPIWEPFNLYKKITGEKKGVGHGFALENKAGGFKGKLKNLAVYIRGNYFIPDARKFFVKPSVSFLENYLKENKIEHLITTGPPHSMHLIGLELKKRMNIKWLADFRDPWTGVYYIKDLKLSAASLRKHERLEKEVLLKADKVVTVGHHLERNLSELGGKDAMNGRTAVVTNGFDTELVENPHQPPGNFFSLVYTGLFSKDQNHESIWQALGELTRENADFKNKLQIHCYGKIDNSIVTSAEQNGLKENFSLHNYVPLAEIGKIQRQASLLLLCINHYPGEKEMLTGKLFDYICSGRPILNVGPEDGDAAAIIKTTHTGFTFNRLEKEKIKQFIAECFQKYLNGTLTVNASNVMQFSRRELSGRLTAILNNL